MRVTGFFALSLLLGVAGPLRADYLWTEGFEAYPTGAIQGKGTTWYVEPGGVDWGGAIGNVVTAPVHTGGKALQVGSQDSFWGGWGDVWWDNDTGTQYGGQVQLSWWMNCTTNRYWYVDVDGWYYSGGVVSREIASITTRHGSANTWLDVNTTGGWVETPAILPNDTWKHVFLEIDFSASPDVYRVRVGDSAAWYGPFTLGQDTQYLRTLRFTCGNINPATKFYFDDFSIVPEPRSFVLLAGGGIWALGFACRWRKRRAKPALHAIESF